MRHTSIGYTRFADVLGLAADQYEDGRFWIYKGDVQVARYYRHTTEVWFVEYRHMPEAVKGFDTLHQAMRYIWLKIQKPKDETTKTEMV